MSNFQKGKKGSKASSSNKEASTPTPIPPSDDVATGLNVAKRKRSEVEDRQEEEENSLYTPLTATKGQRKPLLMQKLIPEEDEIQEEPLLDHIFHRQKVLENMFMKMIDTMENIQETLNSINIRCLTVFDDHYPLQIEERIHGDCRATTKWRDNNNVSGKCIVCMGTKEHSKQNKAVKICENCSLRFDAPIKLCNGCWEGHLITIGRKNRGLEIRLEVINCYKLSVENMLLMYF